MSPFVKDNLGGPNPYKSRAGHGCICGAHMLEKENGGTCLKCGHGFPTNILEHAYRLLSRNNVGPRVAQVGRMDARVVPITRARSHRWTEETCAAAYRRWEADHGRPPALVDWQASANGEDRPCYSTVWSLFGGWKAFLRYIAEVPREESAVAHA
jgi:hypothetical protein